LDDPLRFRRISGERLKLLLGSSSLLLSSLLDELLGLSRLVAYESFSSDEEEGEDEDEDDEEVEDLSLQETQRTRDRERGGKLLWIF
jgi:hypothetical protein